MHGIEIAVHSLGIPIAKRMVPINPKLGLDFCSVSLGNGVMILMQIPKPPSRSTRRAARTEPGVDLLLAPTLEPMFFHVFSNFYSNLWLIFNFWQTLRGSISAVKLLNC